MFLEQQKLYKSLILTACVRQSTMFFCYTTNPFAGHLSKKANFVNNFFSEKCLTFVNLVYYY